MALYDFVYRFAIFPWQQMRNGKKLIATLSSLQNELGSSVADAQRDRLRNIVTHAAEDCSYWQGLFDQSGISPGKVESIEDLASLPLLTKQTVRDRLEELSSNSFRESRQTATTGGSTASPMKFYRDQSCADFREAVRADYWKSVGKNPLDRWANIWGALSDLGNLKSTKNRLKAKLFRRVVFIPSNMLDKNTVVQFGRELQTFQPKLIHGYSQAVYLFAKLLEEQGMKFPDSVETITTTAEPLHDYQKSYLEESTGKPVYRVYGTREFGFIGGELPNHEGLNINPLNTIIEIVDPDGNPVANGEPGQIVITDLVNYATPLIRYQIGDIGTWCKSTCDQDGWQSIKIEAGRETDFVVSAEGRMVGGASMTLINSKGINQLQYVQTKENHLTVRYVPNNNFEDLDIDSLRQQIHGVVGDLQLEFEECDRIEPTRSGKFQYVFSEVSREILGIRQK